MERSDAEGCLVVMWQALHKYKQKRKNLCFTKKIRYESRKQLAQARPRVKGQFVRMAPGAAGEGENDGDTEAAAEADVVEMLGDLPNMPNASMAALAAAKAAAEEEGMDFQDEVSLHHLPLAFILHFQSADLSL